MEPTPAKKSTILVIDDDLKVRHMISGLLAREGFETITAADGSEAIHIFAERSGEISAVTLDLEMPTTNGKEALAMLSAYAPTLPIVIASGLPLPDDLLGRVPGTRGVGYIQKPFTGQALAAELRRVIAES